MRLVHLSLTNFRNFKQLELSFPAGPMMLVGANAQGKTSLLEAIHYLAGASSPHASSDRQLIRFDALKDQPAVARVVGELGGEGGSVRIEIRVILEQRSPRRDPRLRKEVLIDGVKRRMRQLHGHFLAVLFLPQDLRAIEGPPSERRRLLDDALSQGEPDYAALSTEYGKVLTQRNALLKAMRDRSRDSRELAFWDRRLIGLAVKIMRARGIMLAELQALADPIHRALSRGLESLRLEYQPSLDVLSNPGQRSRSSAPGGEARTEWESRDEESLANSMVEALQQIRGQEMQRAQTLLGPHRDEVGFSVNEVDLRTYGSRGQNRTAMLALKLAEVEWLRKRRGENPVLLLDEVLAELDPERRSDLLSRIRNADQAILTAADLGMFGQEFRQTASVWRIEAGRLERTS